MSISCCCFAFIPARYDSNPAGRDCRADSAADIWTFVTYALIHGDLMHLGFNAIWLLAFGTPVARRFGPARFVHFLRRHRERRRRSRISSPMPGRFQPMVGASAIISGSMAAAMRFAFQPGGPLRLAAATRRATTCPALPLSDALRDPRILAFIAVWFGLNLLFGIGSLSITGDDQAVAWQAHVGGFIGGLVTVRVVRSGYGNAIPRLEQDDYDRSDLKS